MRTYKANYYHTNKAARNYYKVTAQLYPQLKETIKEDMAKNKAVKVGLTLEVKYYKTQPDGNGLKDSDVQNALMKSSTDRTMLNETKIDEVVELMMGGDYMRN